MTALLFISYDEWAYDGAAGSVSAGERSLLRRVKTEGSNGRDISYMRMSTGY